MLVSLYQSQQATEKANGTQWIILFTMFRRPMIRILIRPIYDGQIITMSVVWMDSVTCKRPIHNLQSAIVHSFGHRQQTFSHPFLNVLIVPRWNTVEESMSRNTNMLECMFSVTQSGNAQRIWNIFWLDINFLKRRQLMCQRADLVCMGFNDMTRITNTKVEETSSHTHSRCSLVLLPLMN